MVQDEFRRWYDRDSIWAPSDLHLSTAMICRIVGTPWLLCVCPAVVPIGKRTVKMPCFNQVVSPVLVHRLCDLIA